MLVRSSSNNIASIPKDFNIQEGVSLVYELD
jgi:hypothetical protein